MKNDKLGYSGNTVSDINEELEKKKNGSEKKTRKYNLLIYILSLLLAIILWFFVMSVEAPSSESTFKGIEVVLENVTELQSSKNLSVVTGSGNTLDITLRGKKSALNKIKPGDIRAYVDLSSIKEAGTYELTVDYELPSGTEFISASLSTISVYVDTTTAQMVPVKVYLADYILEAGHEIGTPVPAITQILVQGSRSVIEKITEARVTLSSLGKISESFEANEVIVLCDENGNEVNSRFISVPRTTVNVSVPVYITKAIPLTVSYKYGYFTDQNVNVSVNPATITIKGDSASVSAVNSIEIATLDEKSIDKDMTINYTVTLPANVICENFDRSATVTVKHIGTLTKDVVVNKLKVVNAPADIEYSFAEPTIKVSTRCASDRSSQVNMDTVVAEIDFSSIGSQRGTLTLPATINFIGEAYGAAYELGTYSVTVNISDIPPIEPVE